MTDVIYIDTSALAKWYLNEAESDEVEAYIQRHGPLAISELTVVEMRCLLGRRRRDRDIDSKIELRIFAAFQEDVRQGFLICHPFFNGIAAAALNLLSMLSHTPLRSLDAFHLAIVKEIQATALATADRVMAEAAMELGVAVTRFDKPSPRQ